MQDSAINYKNLNIRKGYGVTISKQQLADLPAAPTKGKPSWWIPARMLKKLRKCSGAPALSDSTLRQNQVSNGARHIMSLCSSLPRGDTCFLIRLNHIGLPKSIQEILEDSSFLK